MSVTLTDIAQRVGCSVATVSRALNDTACVNRKTHARILAAAGELGDHQILGQTRGATARRPGRPRGSLRKSDAVDIVLFRREGVEPLIPSHDGLTLAPLTEAFPDHFFAPRYRLITDFYRHIIEGALSVLAADGLKAVQQVRRDLLDETFLHELHVARRRGVLLLGEADASVQTFVARCQRPVVLVDILSAAACPVVTIDNAGGIAAMARHLMDLGHRAIGFAGNAANPGYRERRLQYFGQMLEAGLPVRQEWLYDGPTHVEDVEQGMRRLLTRKTRPTAMMCCSDWAAMGVIRAAQGLGLHVPRDLSVAGFDDVDAAALVTPPLTTVRVPMAQLGCVGVRLLLAHAAGTSDGNSGCETRLRTHLVLRQSTAAPAS